jgi:uncharacterized membrane protein
MTRFARIAGWVVMMLLASMIAFLSLRYFIVRPELAIDPRLGNNFASHLPVFLVHVSGGILALFLGPWQFWTSLRNRLLSLHRWVGRLYLCAVLLGSLAGLYLATMAFGGLPSHLGFALLALLWLTTAVMAYLRVRQGDLDAHREWMIRNYALTFAAVTLRLWLPLMMATGFDFTVAYITVAWLCWVPNLIAAELYISSAKAKGKRVLVADKYAIQQNG